MQQVIKSPSGVSVFLCLKPSEEKGSGSKRRAAMGWLWLLLLLQDPVPGAASSGVEGITEQTTALGESVTFQLKASQPYTAIIWLKNNPDKDPSDVAVLYPEERCPLNVFLPSFQGRLNASEDCRRLQVRDLRRGDSGRYTAERFFRHTSKTLQETFDLRVYKRLSTTDLTIQCHTAGSGTRQLNCSAGPWEDDVAFGWEDESKAEPWGQSATRILRVNDEDDLNVTCRARNPVGEASRTVSLKETCDGTASSGAEDATEVTGALGESVTFQLKTSLPFKLISWLKSERNKDPSNLAILKPGERCTPDLLLRAFVERLNASEDCRRLQVRDLRPGDSGRYTAQIHRGGTSEPLKETFDLQVYKRLSEADLTVQCHTTGSGTRQLNCSAGPWEDDVVFGWEDESKAEPWGKSAIMELSRNDLNVTCRARNPVGEASRTVSVQEICAGLNGVQVSSLLLGVTVAVLIAAKVTVSACVFAKWPCCPGRKRDSPAHLGLMKGEAARKPSPPPP